MKKLSCTEEKKNINRILNNALRKDLYTLLVTYTFRESMMQWVKLILNNMIKDHLEVEDYDDFTNYIDVVLDHLIDTPGENYWNEISFKLGVLYHVDARLKSKVSSNVLLAEIFIAAIVVSDKVNTEPTTDNMDFIEGGFTYFLNLQDPVEALQRLNKIEVKHLQAIDYCANTKIDNLVEIFKKYSNEVIRELFLAEAESYKYFDKDDNSHLCPFDFPSYLKLSPYAKKSDLNKRIEQVNPVNTTFQKIEEVKSLDSVPLSNATTQIHSLVDMRSDLPREAQELHGFFSTLLKKEDAILVSPEKINKDKQIKNDKVSVPEPRVFNISKYLNV